MPPIDDTDRRILNRIQSKFPITPRPYKTIAEELGLSEDETLRRISRLKDKDIIRRIGGNFVPEKVGFVSERGIEIIPLKYEDAGDFHEGLAAVQQDGKWGYINRMGRMVIKPRWDEAGYFSEGRAFVSEQVDHVAEEEGISWEWVETKWWIIDRGGNMLNDERFAAPTFSAPVLDLSSRDDIAAVKQALAGVEVNL